MSAPGPRTYPLPIPPPQAGRFSVAASRQSDAQISQRRLIAPTNAADRLNVSPGTIRTYIADGKLRVYKIGQLIKVDVKEVDALGVTIDNS
jgi:excisionase family DNA binding protein